jgi:type VI secretion system protein ImpJ
MTLEDKVIWHEGMFLKPQHFQHFERVIESSIQFKCSALKSNYFGFYELMLDENLLALNKIGIISSAGIFPDGTAFKFGATDLAPLPLDINELKQDLKVCLCLPLKRNGVFEAANKSSTQLFRYEIYTKMLSDLVGPENISAEIQLGRAALQIRREDDDLSSFTTLNIAKIDATKLSHGLVLSAEFIPPCLDIAASPFLEKILSELSDLLHFRSKTLAARLAETQQSGTAEIIDLILLQLSNRYASIFQLLRQERPLHPELFFSNSINLLAEVSTFTNPKHQVSQQFSYQHTELYESITPVMNEIRKALSTVLEQHAFSIKLEPQGLGLWIGQMNNKLSIIESNLILAIYADHTVDQDNLIAQIKIAPVEQIQTLISKALPGIVIQALTIAPREIPYHTHYSYFRLILTEEIKKELISSAGIAVHIAGKYSELKLELWAIRSQ